MTGAEARGLQLLNATDFVATSGRGIAGRVDGDQVVIGTESFLTENRVYLAPGSARVAELREQGQTVVLVAVNGALAGLLGVADPLKASAPGAISELRARSAHRHAHG